MQRTIACGSASSTCIPTYNSVPRLPHIAASTVLPSKWRHRFPCLEAFSLKGTNLPQKGIKRGKRQFRCTSVRDSASANDHTTLIAPLQPESPMGQLLVQLLQSHPHLVSAAAEQQLDKMAEDRDAASGQERHNTTLTELVLYRRIAELKVQQRRNALEEIMYALIVQKFVAAGVFMVPKILSASTTSDKVDSWRMQDRELESIHSREALEMLREHLAIVLGGRDASDYIDPNVIAQISKLRVGKVYSASIIYGYFLRRVDERFQLEKRMKTLPPGLEDAADAEQAGEHETVIGKKSEQDNLAAEAAAAVAAMLRSTEMRQELNSTGFAEGGMKPIKLRTYVQSFGRETLQKYTTLRTKESMNVIEKQTEALFGRPEIQMLQQDGPLALAKDDLIKLSYGGLKKLVLEATALGTFLWDVESHVDTRYNFLKQ